MPSYLTFKTPYFQCRLQCGQCTHIKNDGTRCRNRVCVGYPTCWIHNKIMYGVKVRDSQEIPGIKGLFATKDFQRDDWICPLNGELIDLGCLNARYPGDRVAPYAVDFVEEGDPLYIDSACERGIGSMSNARFFADGTIKDQGSHNSKITEPQPGSGQLWLRATKNIRRNTEIFTWYGAGGYNINEIFPHQTSRRTTADTRPC